ncbi:DUF58 domain-containing protein [Paracoccus sp. CPCC 101403]|uniref:DUF58 domain-containing protein n=1 Tax=Paracoccus broussonetiae TaxID=3075834 RepID=A0ABU3EJ60_9RHOB|nr:DUF58 domain-containing protein [Paracoccus sp. CPCC 101403]MDT1064287.1 DUF58 domain-containing protein [Paracoccus sp. CPCC 101403]
MRKPSLSAGQAPQLAGGDPRVHTTLQHLVALEGRARRFDFLPRQPVGSVLSGRRASRLRGRGLEFEEIRAYLPGDDPRSMDWRVTARTGSPHVRVTREERDRPALIVVDQRQAMFFGTRLNMKSVSAAELAALTAWRILAAGDRVGGLVLSDSGIEDQRPARSRGAVLRLLSLIAQRNAALSAEAPVVDDAPGMLNLALEQAARIVKHDWLVVILSDFDGADDETFHALSRLSRNNDLVLGLVFDPMAHELPAEGRLVVGNGRLQVELDLSARKVQQNLAETGGKRLRRLLAWQERLDAAILPITAAEETLPQVLRLFGSGRAPRGLSLPDDAMVKGDMS